MYVLYHCTMCTRHPNLVSFAIPTFYILIHRIFTFTCMTGFYPSECASMEIVALNSFCTHPTILQSAPISKSFAYAFLVVHSSNFVPDIRFHRHGLQLSLSPDAGKIEIQCYKVLLYTDFGSKYLP